MYKQIETDKKNHENWAYKNSHEEEAYPINTFIQPCLLAELKHILGQTARTLVHLENILIVQLM